MSRTYKATGINLKSAPFGESDRLLTILTDEYGLLRVVAPGARKHRSSLGGRSSLFVVNQLLIAKGRSLDKIVQAESLESFPKISQNLAKLTAAQYLAELALFQALSDQPQAELFCLLQAQLSRLETLPAKATLASLTHATFQLLALAGLTPQLQTCCLTQVQIWPESGEIGFSVTAGGLVRLDQVERHPKPRLKSGLPKSGLLRSGLPKSNSLNSSLRMAAPAGHYSLDGSDQGSEKSMQREPVPSQPLPSSPNLLLRLNSAEISLLQQLQQPDLIQDLLEADSALLHSPYQANWLTLERLLRHYAQYHFDRPIRSAGLIDVCFTASDPLSPA